MAGARIPDRTLIRPRLDERPAQPGTWNMLDFIYLAIALGFFLLMAAYARYTARG
jgi:hypothetical protein